MADVLGSCEQALTLSHRGRGPRQHAAGDAMSRWRHEDVQGQELTRR